MSFPIANPDAPVSYSTAGPTSRLTARAVAAASATPPLTSSKAVLTFVNFSSILQGGHNGGATSSSEASLPSSSSTSASVSESTTSNSNFSSTESKALPVGVIVGGSIGGLAVVLMAIILLVSARHQSRRMRGLGARGGMTRMANRMLSFNLSQIVFLNLGTSSQRSATPNHRSHAIYYERTFQQPELEYYATTILLLCEQ